MIVVEIKLTSAISADRDRELGTMVLDNITTHNNSKKGDYRARMYRKGDLKKYGGSFGLVAHAKYTREAKVLDHNRIAEPVQNLVAKALTAMGYG